MTCESSKPKEFQGNSVIVWSGIADVDSNNTYRNIMDKLQGFETHLGGVETNNGSFAKTISVPSDQAENASKLVDSYLAEGHTRTFIHSNKDWQDLLPEELKYKIPFQNGPIKIAACRHPHIDWSPKEFLNPIQLVEKLEQMGVEYDIVREEGDYGVWSVRVTEDNFQKLTNQNENLDIRIVKIELPKMEYHWSAGLVGMNRYGRAFLLTPEQRMAANNGESIPEPVICFDDHNPYDQGSLAQQLEALKPHV